MRLHILSDLHLEFGQVDIPPTEADVVVMAGDIHLGPNGCRWARKQFPDQPVIYVPGNHEYYHHSLPELVGTLKAEMEGSNVCVLENDAVEIGGITFLGCTLWTDFQLSGDPDEAMRMVEHTMGDFQVIRYSPKHRTLQPPDTVRVHGESVAWLRGQLAKGNPARTVVVTHHAPSARGEAPYHAEEPAEAGVFIEFGCAGLGGAGCRCMDLCRFCTRISTRADFMAGKDAGADESTVRFIRMSGVWGLMRGWWVEV